MKTEQVLAVPASCLWSRVSYTEKGLIRDGIDELAPLVVRCGVFLERPAAEVDPGHKQIIPYAVIRNGEFCFLLKRKPAQSEQRLHHKLSVGVGGHINPDELRGGSDAVEDGLTRELNEELHIPTGYQTRLIGLINDDTTEVGRVHLGVLFEVVSASPDVRVRETGKMEGSWAPLEALKENYDSLETWSQIVFDAHLCREMLNSQTIEQSGHR
jgi:predicted NUDIX family phosphoesterase